jgi:hypothetical protein
MFYLWVSYAGMVEPKYGERLALSASSPSAFGWYFIGITISTSNMEEARFYQTFSAYKSQPFNTPAGHCPDMLCSVTPLIFQKKKITLFSEIYKN